MNRKRISDAISNIDELYITESLNLPCESADHVSERTIIMKQQKKTIHFRRLTGIILAACLIFTLAVSVYAADVGGIRRMLQMWFFGDLTTAVLDIQDGGYMVMAEDGTVLRSGGGVVFGPDGVERPVTEEEILEHLNEPDLLYQEDGTVWLFYHNQKIEITDDMYDAEGFCYLELRDGKDVIYATIEKGGGMSTSPVEYIKPYIIVADP